MIEVAVGLVLDARQQVLIARRQKHQHQGGLWEFPGGKREPEEDRLSALKRELQEEVGIDVQAAQPFQQITHDYGDKQVLLDIWLVTVFSGEAFGREGQQVRWAEVASLDETDFPAANQTIISALQQYLSQ